MLKSLCIFILPSADTHSLQHFIRLSFSEEIQCFLDFVHGSRLVDADVTDASQEGEVDDAVLVFLIVVHQLYQFIVVITGDRQCAVDSLMKLTVCLIFSVGKPVCVALRYSSQIIPKATA